ncbi:MAG: glycoside hydrolase family 28 protein [Bacteroidota bacterium]|nr:glycoside hydrolase family 28 protein [Bacteroidota bacterium]
MIAQRFFSYRQIIVFLCFVLAGFTGISSSISAQAYNVKDFGAKNDGIQKNTEAIKKAIDAAVKGGGGTVYFPAGTFLTGPIELKSNISILLDAGAVIKFSDDFDDYLPMVQSRYEGIDVMSFHPLFYAWKADNISITGHGTIDGQGKKWWDFAESLPAKPKGFRSKWQRISDSLNYQVQADPEVPSMIARAFLRPPFIQPMYCKNVRIEGVTIQNSPFWTVNPEFCDNVVVDKVTINNPHSPNTDGINPESCSNVHISNCHISVGDDCITIKSGKDKAGRKMNAPAENYTITNCTMLSGHGGVVIGSEMSGGVKKIVISNCIFDGTDRGIRIKTARGRGGVVEDIRVSNVVMKNIKLEAITLNMFYDKADAEPVTERTPTFRNMHFSGITGNASQAGSLIGIEEMPIRDITFNDIQLKTKTGFTVSNSENIAFHNLQIDAEDGRAILVEKSSQIEVNGLKSLTPQLAVPLVEFRDVKEAFVHGCYQPVKTDVFLKVDGAASENIALSSNNLRLAKDEIVKTTSAPVTAVRKQ